VSLSVFFDRTISKIGIFTNGELSNGKVLRDPAQFLKDWSTELVVERFG
jgi:hypothetical protein